MVTTPLAKSDVDSPSARARPSGHYGGGRGHRRYRTQKRNAQKKRQQYSLGDGDPVAQFDVADFLQSYDNAVDGNARYADAAKNDFRRRKSKGYNNFDNFGNPFSVNANDKRGEGWADSAEEDQNNLAEITHTLKSSTESLDDKNFDYRFAAVDETTKENIDRNRNYLPKSIYDGDMIERSQSIHHQQKKGVLKNIRFPFFSRSKPSTFIPTKDRKRKTSKSSKVERTKSMINVNGQVLNDDKENLYASHLASDFFNKIKRSYIEIMCPECKKKYVANPKAVPQSRDVYDKVIHNSRQFFQNQVVGRSNGKDKKDTVSWPDVGRKRRQYYDGGRENKERQLQELEEVARKIESVNCIKGRLLRCADFLRYTFPLRSYQRGNVTQVSNGPRPRYPKAWEGADEEWAIFAGDASRANAVRDTLSIFKCAIKRSRSRRASSDRRQACR
ncbi:unnamed protein product, partial [Iphiclides podalirius]